MRRAARLGWLVFGASVLLAGVLIKSLDDETLRSALTSRVKAATGRELIIDGPFALDYWPKLHLRVGDARLGNPPGFDAAPLLRVRQLEVALAILPLLRGELEFDTLRIDGLELSLARNAAGETNWDFSAKAGFEGDAAALDGLAAFALGGVDVRDTRLGWRDARAGRQIELQDVSLQIAPLAFGEPVDFSLQAELDTGDKGPRGPVELKGTARYSPTRGRYTIAPLSLDARLRGARLPGGDTRITARSELRIDPARGRFALRGFEASGLGHQLRAELRLDHLREGTPGGKVNVALETADLLPLLQLLGAPVAREAARLPSRRGQLKLQGMLDRQSGVLALPVFEGQILGLAFKARAAGAGFATGAPVVSASWEMNTRNLPRTVLTAHALLHPEAPGTALAKVMQRVRDRTGRVRGDAVIDAQARQLILPTFDAQGLDARLVARLDPAPADHDAEGHIGFESAQPTAALTAYAGFAGADGAALTSLAELLEARAVKRMKLEFATRVQARLGRYAVTTTSGELMGNTARVEASWLQSESGALEGALAVAMEGTDLPAVMGVLGSLSGAPRLVSATGASLPQRPFTWRFAANAKGRRENLTLAPLDSTLTLPAFETLPEATLSLDAAPVGVNAINGHIDAGKIVLRAPGIEAMTSLSRRGDDELAMLVDIPSFDLQASARGLGLALPPGPAGHIERVGFKAALHQNPDARWMDGLTLTVDGSTLQGEIRQATTGSGATTFALTLDQLDTDRYANPANEKSTLVTPEVLALGAMQLPLVTLREAAFAGHLEISALKIGGLSLTGIAVDTKAEGGKLAFEPLRATLYGGQYSGRVQLDARGAVPALALETALAKVDLAPLLADIGQGDGISGNLNFEARLQIQGNSPRQQLASLQGPASFALSKGRINGIDLPAVLGLGEKVLKTRKLSSPPKGGYTDFDSLTGSLRIERGLVRNEDLLLDGAGFHVTGKGLLADLNRQRIDYRAELAVPPEERGNTALAALTGKVIPVRCVGSLDVSSCKPDLASLLKTALKGVVDNGLGRKIEKEARGAGRALRNLLDL
jgi:uncharacterized protein involved in outer membrane biogenesis